MRAIVSAVLARPKLALAALLVVTAAAVSQLGKLDIQVDTASLLSDHDAERAFYRGVLQTYGDEPFAVVFVEDERLFSEAKVAALKAAVERLRGLAAVGKVVSLFGVHNVKHANGGLSFEPFFAAAAATEADRAAAVRDALRNPFARHLLSADATATLIYVHAGHPASSPPAALADQIERAIAPLEETLAFVSVESSFERVFQTGPADAGRALGDVIGVDRYLLPALAAVVVMVALGLRMKSFSALWLALPVAGLSIVWTLGVMAALGLSLNALTLAVPLLIVVLGSAQYAHLLDHYRATIAAGDEARKALLTMADKSGPRFYFATVLLSLSLAFAGLHGPEMLRQFGLAAAAGLGFNALACATVLPLYLLAVGPRCGPADGRRSVFDYAADLRQTLLANRVHRLVLALALSLAAVAGAAWLEVAHHPAMFFARQSGVQARADAVARQLHGLRTFSIVFDAARPGAFVEPAFLGEVKKVQDYIAQMKHFDASLSLADLVALLNREANGGDERHYHLPASAQLTRRYLDEFAAAGGAVESYAAADFSQTVVHVWHHLPTSAQLRLSLARLEEFTDTLDKRLTVRFTGQEVLLDRAAGVLLEHHLKSLAWLGLAVVALVSALFLTWKAGLLVLAPNLVTLAVLYGAMGYLGVPLSVATAAAAFVLVAFTSYAALTLMLRHNEAIRAAGNDQAGAVERTLEAELGPLIATAITLSVGFVPLLLSGLPPLAQLGQLLPPLLLVGLLANCYVMPQLLSAMRFVTLWGMADVNVGHNLTDRSELFAGMRAWQIKRLILMSAVRDVAAGEAFVKQGAVGQEMFVILEGRARAEKVDAEGNRQLLHRFQDGDVVGEIALVSRRERTADIVAETDLKLLVLEWQALERLGRYLPNIAARLFLNIARIIGQRLS